MPRSSKPKFPKWMYDPGLHRAGKEAYDKIKAGHPFEQAITDTSNKHLLHPSKIRVIVAQRMGWDVHIPSENQLMKERKTMLIQLNMDRRNPGEDE